MKISRLASILGFALAALSPLANAQLITRTFDVSGSTGVTSRFTIWIDATSNTFVVDINNALPATNNAYVGTLVGFAFNTPFAITAQTGNADNSSVKFKSQWWGSGQTASNPSGSWKNDDYWTELPTSNGGYYNVDGKSYDQDYGVYTSSESKGVKYGQKATFSFTFSSNVTAGNIANFFDNAFSQTNHNNRDYDVTVEWTGVTQKKNYPSDCGTYCDIGGYDIPFFQEGDLPPTPEPSTYGLMGAGALLGLVAHRRMKAKKARAA